MNVLVVEQRLIPVHFTPRRREMIHTVRTCYILPPFAHASNPERLKATHCARSDQHNMRSMIDVQLPRQCKALSVGGPLPMSGLARDLLACHRCAYVD